MRVSPYSIRGAKALIASTHQKLQKTTGKGFTRRYTAAISPIIVPEKDKTAPDVNTNPQIMSGSWIHTACDRLYRTRRCYRKPDEIGGSLGRFEATGMGLMHTTKKILEKNKHGHAQTRIAF
jgi:glutamate dehydrogenase/leucine dehydrogenase